MSAGLHNILDVVDPRPVTAASSGSHGVHGHSFNDLNGHHDSHVNSSGQGFKLGDFPIDDVRRIKVIVVGAGFAGVVAGIRHVATWLLDHDGLQITN